MNPVRKPEGYATPTTQFSNGIGLSFLRRWVIGSVAAGVVFMVGQGIAFTSFYAACIIALMIGLLNAALPYIISMMTFMQSVLTLGLATLVVNALTLHILQEARLGVYFTSFDAMVLIAIMISTIAWFSTLAMDTSLHNKT